jgi:DNA-binding transcriptional LysR family regulator
MYAIFAFMNLEYLRIAIEISQQGNFSAVAKLRNMDPSVVSRIVQTLERDLGARIFQRSARHVTLTEAGGRYLNRILPLVDALDSARDEIKSLEKQPKGVLRITASVAFGQVCLVPLVPAFSRAYPEVELELFLTDTNLDLISERIDIALRLSPHMAQDMIRVKWFNSSYVVCASPTYLKQQKPLREIADLQEHRFVLFGLPNPQANWVVRAVAGDIQHVAVSAAVVASNGLAQRDLVLSGIGPALMPIWLASSGLEDGSLVQVLPDLAITPNHFEGAAWILYPNRSFLPAKTRAMVDFLLSESLDAKPTPT